MYELRILEERIGWRPKGEQGVDKYPYSNSLKRIIVKVLHGIKRWVLSEQKRAMSD
jgi:hypothetical protein